MMGQRKSEPQLFNYAVNLEKRVRARSSAAPGQSGHRFWFCASAQFQISRHFARKNIQTVERTVNDSRSRVRGKLCDA